MAKREVGSAGFKIRPTAFVDGSYRTGRIEGLTADEISEIIGFKPNVDDDPWKVKYSWAGEVVGTWRREGRERLVKNETTAIAIWDYKGSWTVHRFSTYGEDDILARLFGKNYHGESP